MQEKAEARFLTSFEVAAACGVSARTVTNWIRGGSIPAHRTLGGHARVSANDLRRFLSAQGMPVPDDLLPAEPRLSRPSRRPPPQPTDGPERRLGKRRVLLIDDDEPLLEVLSEVLSQAGYEVETARHGFLGGYLLAHCKPDAIVCDIMMPGLDGFEVVSLIRKRPEAIGVPIVACTSLKGAEAEARIRAAGFDAYVKKPVDFAQLQKVLQGLIH